MMPRTKLYLTIGIACLGGYIWLLSTHSRYQGIDSPDIGMCIIKTTTNIPCPSCGTTRSVLSIIKGHFKDAFLWNPFGFLIATLMITLPPWLLYDLISKRSSLFRAFGKIEKITKQKSVAIPAIILVIVNWIWNIYKNY